MSNTANNTAANAASANSPTPKDDFYHQSYGFKAREGDGTMQSDQPAFNIGSGAEPLTRSLKGFVELKKGTRKLKVGADDNATFYLVSFPNSKAIKAPMGPQGGGSFAYSTEVNVVIEKDGYYKVKIDYTNIDYVGHVPNAARLEVLIDGTAIELGDVLNIMTAADATNLMAKYNVCNYINMPNHSQVWAAIGGTAKDAWSPDGASCAARISKAFIDYGITLPAEPDLHKPGKYLNYKNAAGKHVYVRAMSIHNYMMEQLGAPMLTSKAQFDAMLAKTGAKPIIVWSEFVGSHHVGMGYNNEGNASQGTFGTAQSIWVLNRPDLGDPESSAL